MIESERELTTKRHVIYASEKFALKIKLSAGDRHDVPENRKLIESFSCKTGCYLLMDRAYEDSETQALVRNQGIIPVAPQRKTEKHLLDNMM